MLVESDRGNQTLTKTMVTKVNTRTVFAWRAVSLACSRPNSASLIPACFWRSSRRVLIYIESEFRHGRMAPEHVPHLEQTLPP